MGICGAKSKPRESLKIPTICFNSPNSNIGQNQMNEEKAQSIDIDATPMGKFETTIISKENVNNFYNFSKFLGSGGFGTDNNSTFNSVRQELLILKQIDHPNVLKFLEIYEDSDYFHIVTEYCPNGDLLHYISKNNLIEQDAKQIIYNLLLAVNHLHSHDICHRDIKPQNILFTKNNDIKLIDFGLSIKLGGEQECLKEKVGTLLYVAPEVLTGNYQKNCDIWSIGIILFILLTGEIPYDFAEKRDLYRIIKTGRVAYHKCPWENISDDAADILKKMLTVEPDQRITIQQALKHPWLQELNNSTKVLSPNIINNIQNNFLIGERFKKEILKIIVTQLSEDQILKLKNAFKKFDINNRGMISFEELGIVIKQLGLEGSESQISEIMKKIHIESSNLTPKHQQIHYSEFIACTLDYQKILNREILYTLFKEITGDKNTFNKKDLQNFMARKGRKLSHECLQQMMDEIDLNKYGDVDFSQFSSMIIKQDQEEEKIERKDQIVRTKKKSVSKILAINKKLQNKEELF